MLNSVSHICELRHLETRKVSKTHRKRCRSRSAASIGDDPQTTRALPLGPISGRGSRRPRPDAELAMLDVVEVVALPAPVGGGVRPEVHGDVEDPAASAANQLCLTALQVKPAQHSGGGAAVVLLDEVELDPHQP